MELRNTEKLEKSIVALTIAVSAEELENGKQAAFKKNGKKITVPGFRKGKAPRHLIEQLYGTGVFFEDAVNICFPDAYDKAIEEAGIKPISSADVDMQDMPEEGGFVFIATVPVEPEVTLGEYKGLDTEKEEVKVLVADIKAELDRMAQRIARTETVERAAKNGDTVVIDFDGYVDGVAFEGGKSEGHSLTLGSGSFIPGFEEQLVGTVAGDDKDVTVVFPEEYHAEELKGKSAVFKCTVHSVQETVLPKLDDEFAKDVSDSCETIDELKAEIKERLTKTREEQADQEMEENLLDSIIRQLQADIPDVMIEKQIDSIVQDFSYRLQMQGMKLEQYMQSSGMDAGQFRNMFATQADRQVKVRLALQKVVALENVEIADADLDEEYAKMADSYSIPEERVRKMVAADSLRSDLCLTKALDVIKASAKIKKKTAKKKTATEVDSADEIVAAE